MERDYMKKIQDCSEKIGELEKELETLYQRLNELFDSKNVDGFDMELYFRGHTCSLIRKGFTESDINRLRMLLINIEVTEDEVSICKARRNALRRAYQRNHSTEYFKPMDEIDIRITIDRNGSIRGRLL